MKGMQGIVIASALAIVGAVCNWFYIMQQARDLKRMDFIAISDDANGVQLGTKFEGKHFMKVSIPENNLGNINQVAVPWSELKAVEGDRAPRLYEPGELLLRHDLMQPPVEPINEQLGPDERLKFILVDPNGFNASLINPHDWVSFSFLTAGNKDGVSASEIQEVGPFEVLSLGNRRGRIEILKAKGRSAGQENLIGIRVLYENGRMKPQYEQLFDLYRGAAKASVHVSLHSDKTKP